MKAAAQWLTTSMQCAAIHLQRQPANMQCLLHHSRKRSSMNAMMHRNEPCWASACTACPYSRPCTSAWARTPLTMRACARAASVTPDPHPPVPPSPRAHTPTCRQGSWSPGSARATSPSPLLWTPGPVHMLGCQHGSAPSSRVPVQKRRAAWAA